MGLPTLMDWGQFPEGLWWEAVYHHWGPVQGNHSVWIVTPAPCRGWSCAKEFPSLKQTNCSAPWVNNVLASWEMIWWDSSAYSWELFLDSFQSLHLQRVLVILVGSRVETIDAAQRIPWREGSAVQGYQKGKTAVWELVQKCNPGNSLHFWHFSFLCCKVPLGPNDTRSKIPKIWCPRFAVL